MLYIELKSNLTKVVHIDTATTLFASYWGGEVIQPPKKCLILTDSLSSVKEGCSVV
jgi:hypothetical protein